MNKIKIQIQNEIEKLKKENLIEIKNNILKIIKNNNLTIEQQHKLISEFLIFYINFYIEKNKKSKIFKNIKNLFKILINEIKHCCNFLFKLLILIKKIKFQKIILKFLLQIKFENKNKNNFKNILKEILFKNNSIKIHLIIIKILYKNFELEKKDFEEFSILFLNKKLFLENKNKKKLKEKIEFFELFLKKKEQLKYINNTIILFLFSNFNEIYNEKFKNEITNEIIQRFDNFDSNEIRKIFLIIIHFFKHFKTEENENIQLIKHILISIQNYPKILFNILHYLNDFPIIQNISNILLTQQIISNEEFCKSKEITNNNSEEQFFCFARIFENQSNHSSFNTILIKITEEEVLERMKIQQEIGIIDFLLYSPKIIKKQKNELFELLEVYLEKETKLYHNYYSNIFLIIKLIIKYFKNESMLLISNFLVENEIEFELKNNLIFEQELFSFSYIKNPIKKEFNFLNKNEKNVMIIDTFLKFNYIEMNVKKRIEENYVIPLLTNENTIYLGLLLMKNHFLDDMMKLFPLLIEKYWNTNKQIQFKMIEILFKLINKKGILEIEHIMKNVLKINNENTQYTSLGTNSFSQILNYSFDFELISLIPREIIKEIEKPNCLDILKIKMIKGIIKMMKNENINDPIVVSKILMIILKEQKEYINEFLDILFTLNENIIEEVLISSFYFLLPSKEIHEIISIIEFCKENEIIKGKIMFFSLIESILNGFNKQNKLFMMKIINEITIWNSTHWNNLRGIGIIVFNSLQFTGELEKERLKWLKNSFETKKDDISSLSEHQFSDIYKLLFKV